MATTSSAATRYLALAAVLTSILSLPNGAQAQTAADALRFSDRDPATNARMMGMAGAGGFAGIADYTALLNNPAGLGFFDRSMAAGALHTLSALDQSTAEVAGNRGGSDNSIRQTGLQNLAYVYKFPTSRGSLVIGGAYNQTNTFERELIYSLQNPNNSITDFFTPYPDEFQITADPGSDGIPGTSDDQFTVDWFRDISQIAYETFAIDIIPSLYYAGDPVPFLPAVTAGTVQQDERVTEGGRMHEINLGGAWEAAPGLMTGLSANLAFGKYNFTRRFQEADVNDANNGLPGTNTTDFDRLALTSGFASDLVGFNLRGGVSGQLARGLRAGLSVETPTYYHVNEDYNTFLETFFDNGDHYTYGDLSDDVGSGSYEYRILSPWRFGAGAAFTTSDLTVALDAEFIDWTQMRLRPAGDYGGVDPYEAENLNIRDNYNAVVNTRLGAEYWLGKVALRAGFARQPDARKNGGVDRTRNYLSAGLGYRFGEQAEINVGWMQERFDDQWLPYAGETVANGPEPAVQEEVSRNRFSVGFRFFF
ncbi:MAG TPA: hypothetical protein VFG50_01815 [Rhodothermales bacterium]|nr:hypothetical protein [Rhodothermales bacterium]